MSTYTINNDGHSITCGTCGRTSPHPKDVRNRYCGHCHVFHDDRDMQILMAFLAECRKSSPQLNARLTEIEASIPERVS